MNNQKSFSLAVLIVWLVYPLQAESQSLPEFSIEAVTQSVEEKFEIIVEVSADRILESDVPVVIIGSGDTGYLNPNMHRVSLLYMIEGTTSTIKSTIAVEDDLIREDGLMNIAIIQQYPTADNTVDQLKSSVDVTVVDND